MNKNESNRFEVKYERFEAYFYDNKRKRKMDLQSVCDKLNHLEKYRHRTF